MFHAKIGNISGFSISLDNVYTGIPGGSSYEKSKQKTENGFGVNMFELFFSRLDGGTAVPSDCQGKYNGFSYISGSSLEQHRIIDAFGYIRNRTIYLHKLNRYQSYLRIGRKDTFIGTNYFCPRCRAASKW